MYAFTVAMSVLVGCAFHTTEHVNLSPENTSCKLSGYDRIVEERIAELGPGLKRDLVVKVLADIAIEVWQLPRQQGSPCRVKYQTNFQTAYPIYDVSFPAEISLHIGQKSVCLNHVDLFGSGIAKQPKTGPYKKYPWEYIENTALPDELQTGKFGSRRFLPVCFGADGNIAGFLDGQI